MRICQDRVIETVAGDKSRLKQFARSMPTKTASVVLLRGRDGESKRSVELQLAWDSVQIVPPVRGDKRNQELVEGWCIRCWEPAAAAGLALILVTTVPITDIASAKVQVDWYAHRWIIEEYHKCLKSGCAVQARQLTTAVGWRANPGIFSNCSEGCFYNCVCSAALSQSVWPVPSYHLCYFRW